MATRDIWFGRNVGVAVSVGVGVAVVEPSCDVAMAGDEASPILEIE